ncbi:MAG: Spy/CpxP family protein refolding chaperone [Planctomycetaceae bacterium]|jgi:Spy/CpxP family protein refolding chaperone|nr:Spy/CpxP family protein refolding chaperone [Planctomycetaceae bacterium]
MKRFFLMTALLLTAAAAMTALAQPPAGGPGARGPGGPGGQNNPIGNIWQNDALKAELKLTDEQVAQLKKLSDELRPQRQPQRSGSREQAGPGGNNQPPAPPSREDFEKRMDDFQAKVNQILTPEQQAKSKVLLFQGFGGLDSPFLGARTLNALNLTDEQKAKIKAIEEQRGEKMRTVFQGFRDLSQEERDKRRAELEASGKTFTEQIKAVLTPEQKAKGEQWTAEGKSVREKLGLPEPGQRNDRNRGEARGDGERRRGGSEYRPGAGSWQPGQGAQGQAAQGEQGDQPKRRFPRSEGDAAPAAPTAPVAPTAPAGN